MTSVLLIAASGLASETLATIALLPEMDVVGVLDDNPSHHGTFLDGVPVLGGLEVIGDHVDVGIVVCAGSGQVRRELVRRLTDLGITADRWTSVVHPGAHLAADTAVGRGAIVLAGTVATARVSIGDHVVVMPNVTLTHDNCLGDFATVCAGVSLGGSVVVASGAYLGINSSVRQNVRVGENAVLGMGSVLLGNQPAGSVWAGVPARTLDQLDTSGKD